MRERFSNGSDFGSILSTLANANLGFGVVKNVLASLGRVGGVNTRRNASRNPGSLQREEILSRVESDHSRYIERLHSDFNTGLGKSKFKTRNKSLPHSLLEILSISVLDIVLINDGKSIFPSFTVLDELLGISNHILHIQLPESTVPG